MLARCEKELICDFAQTYHIYNIYEFEPNYIATLAAGLDINSRTIKSINDQKQDLDTLLFAVICDRLGTIGSAFTEGKEIPPSIYDALCGITKQEKENNKSGVTGFESTSDFEDKLKEIRGW